MSNFRSSQTSNKVKMAAQKLASDLREVEHNSLALKNPPGFVGPGSNNWGAYFEVSSTSYPIFVDSLNNYWFNGLNPVKSIKLSEGVKIKNIKLISLNPNGSFKGVMMPASSTLIVKAPNPEISYYIKVPPIPPSSNDVSRAMAQKMVITLSDSQDNNEIDVEINSFGLVDVITN
jgi:hypothetical protein